MSSKRYTDEELVGLVQELARKLGRAPIMREFVQATGVSDATVRRRFRSWHRFAKKALAHASVPSARQAEDADEVEALVTQAHALREKGKAKQNELRKVISGLERQNQKLRDANEFLLGVGEALVDHVPKPIRETRSRRRGLPQASYVMLASDWHMGERVRPEQVGHRNEYNPDIAQERAEQFFRSNITLLNAARSAWHVNQGVLWLGGDLMTGYIHEEYEADNFLSPTEEALLVFDTMVRGIDYLLAESDLERVLVPTSNGNHGRTGKKKRVSDDFRNSYEFMLYRLLARHYEDEPRLEFQLAKGYHNVVDLYGFKARFSHGDAIRSAGGVGGIAPALYRRLGKLAEGGDRADIDCMGHFHTLDFMRKCARNGSLIGYNAFAEFLGCPPEPPMQASFVVDAKHRLASNMNPVLVVKS